MAGGTVVWTASPCWPRAVRRAPDIKYLNVLPVFNADGSIK